METPSGGIRPSNQEIFRKLCDARLAILAGRHVLGVMKHLVGDLDALEIDSERELWMILPTLLEEIIKAGPSECYCGGHPPRRSYDEEMKGMELWPFHWDSPSRSKAMYLKFAMKRDRKGNWAYIHVDVHDDRPMQRF